MANDFEQHWRSLLRERSGAEVWSPAQTFLFQFATERDTGHLIDNWEKEIGFRELYLIGNFATGDMVCAHPDGKLFVLLHDTFEWWDSDVSFAELIRRLDAFDEGLEEDVYSRNRSG